jgi:hypothetical protein
MRRVVGNAHPFSFPIFALMNSATKGRLVGLFGLTCFALWITISLGSSFVLGIESLWWPTTPVRITSSAVSTGVSNVGRWWQPELTYGYDVDGRAYHSNDIRFVMPPNYREDSAREIQAEYPEGTVTKAAYNPRNPSQSVLQPGIPAGLWWRGLIPLFFWTLAGYIFYEILYPERRVLLLPDVEPAVQD